ncbi:MAG: family 10 glycosylhydrolase [Bacteroidales bacterium]|nr:family 10 glycosylhydrolase [Bacteroidales bacterium]
MKRTLTLLLIALLAAAPAFSQEPPKREFRGAWLHIVGNQRIKTLTREQIQDWFTATLDALEAQGCNAVIFQVRPQADAFYASELEPWTRFLTGEQGKAPDPFWDPLQFMIDACHARGMELHAWLNPYRVTSNDREQLHPDHLYFKKPEIFKRYGKQLYFDPGEPESVAHTVRVIADIVSRYDVDAIHFDDYFYPYPEKFEEFHDDASFTKYGAAQGFEYWQKGDWRRHNVETLIHAVNDTIKALKPWVRFGISPFGIHRNLKDTPDGSGSATNGLSNYEELFADVPAWAEKGYIDYIVPQLYWRIGHPAADYDVLIHWWNDKNYKGQLYIGQSIGTFSEPDLDNPAITQTARKMQLVRELPNVDGNVWWPGWSLAESRGFNLADSLRLVYQKHPALIPAYTDLDAVAPDPVASIHASHREISWKPQPTDDVLQQPHFYVVYRFANGEAIDLSDSRHIVKITRDTHYKPAEKHKGLYQYVITVVDKCWNESKESKIIKW